MAKYNVTLTASYVLEIEAESSKSAISAALEEVRTIEPEWEVTDSSCSIADDDLPADEMSSDVP